MQQVFVLSSDRRPLDPCHPVRARKLLHMRRAAIYRRYPFTIILKDRTSSEAATHPHRLKLDPGSKTTGIAIAHETSGKIVWAGELQHRGQQISAALLSRRAVRRNRRSRKCRYRPPRYDNRRRPEGWLPPSLESRIANTLTWVGRLQRCCPVNALSFELVKFDPQAMQNPEISGIEYQQGELFGYEVREYLLEKWQRKCAYCNIKDVPMQIEHITPKSRGGSNRLSNLALACEPCNSAKGNLTAAEFGHPEVQVKARQSLKDVAAMNSTRWALYRRLQQTQLPVEVGTGGRTKFNRTSLKLPKAHWIDAACVGISGERVHVLPALRPLLIRATGHGRRQMCQMDRFGFPRSAAKRFKRVKNFQTGDIVKALIPGGKNASVLIGRIAIRASGSFNITTSAGVVQSIRWHRCRLLHRADGYTYPTTKGDGTDSHA